LKKDGLKMKNAKVEQKKLLGRQVKAVAAAGLVAFALLVGIISCENTVTETKYVDKEVYPEISTSVRVLDGYVPVKFLQGSSSAGLAKINAAMIEIDGMIAHPSPVEDNINKASSGGFEIVVGNYDYDCNRENNIMYINSEWLEENDVSVIRPKISSAMFLFGQELAFNNAKETIRLSRGKFLVPQRQA
jgi:hypothetical protein